jgi:hypothetical protein
VTVTPRTFTLAASNVTVSAGSSGTSTITITPKNGYTGTVGWSISSSPSLTNGCFSLPDATVSSTSAITATMTAYTNSSACSSVSLTGLSAGSGSSVGTLLSVYGNALRPLSPLKAQTCVALAGLLFIGLMGCRRRKLRVLAGVFLLATASFAVSGCGGAGGGGGSGSGSPSLSTSNAAKGTYTVTIFGTDTSSASITASTTMTLTID